MLPQLKLTNSRGVDQAEIDEAIQPDAAALAPAESETEEHKQKKGHRILNFIKATAKGGINTTLAADKVKAKVGAKHAKDRLGVVKTEPDPEKGPISFPARWKGKKGHAYITATATTPALSWTTESDDLDPTWTVSIGDIVVSFSKVQMIKCVETHNFHRRFESLVALDGSPRSLLAGLQIVRSQTVSWLRTPWVKNITSLPSFREMNFSIVWSL